MDNKPKKKKTPIYSNPVEVLKDLPRKNFLDQLMGRRPIARSGEIHPGESLEFKSVITGEREKSEKLSRQITFERRLRAEEKQLVDSQTKKLQLQIQAIQTEVIKVVQKTPQLSQEIKIAALQVSSAPSKYQLFFLERMFTFIQSFRVNIENASLWLESANRRAAQKNRWGANYKKHGAKYLLSGEHYLSRSAA